MEERFVLELRELKLREMDPLSTEKDRAPGFDKQLHEVVSAKKRAQEGELKELVCV